MRTAVDKMKETRSAGDWVLADGKIRDLFPVRKKSHIMNTRRPEKYIVQHAHTERLNNSPILTMQRILNENY